MFRRSNLVLFISLVYSCSSVMAAPRQAIVAAMDTSISAMGSMLAAAKQQDRNALLSSYAQFLDAQSLHTSGTPLSDKLVRSGGMFDGITMSYDLGMNGQAQIPVPLPVKQLKFTYSGTFVSPRVEVNVAAAPYFEGDKGSPQTQPAQTFDTRQMGREGFNAQTHFGAVIFAKPLEVSVRAASRGIGKTKILLTVTFATFEPADSCPTRVQFRAPDIQAGAMGIFGGSYSALSPVVGFLCRQDNAREYATFQAYLEKIAESFTAAATTRKQQLAELSADSVKAYLKSKLVLEEHEYKGKKSVSLRAGQDYEIQSYLRCMENVDEIAPMVQKVQRLIRLAEEKEINITVEAWSGSDRDEETLRPKLEELVAKLNADIAAL